MRYEDIEVGDMIKYKDNTGDTRTRVVGKKRSAVAHDYGSLLVDNSGLGKFHYSVYDDELLAHYTIETHPQHFL